MFREWGFLIGEMVVLLLIAALIGLFVGWLIWGRRDEEDNAGDTLEADRLRSELARCEETCAAQKTELAEVHATAAAAQRKVEDAEAAAAHQAAAQAAALMAADEGGAEEAAAAPEGDNDDRDFDGDGVVEGADEGQRPEALSEAREEGPDDLKMIKGVGPKLELLCNELGFYHFDQIANWSADEVAWVDANLAGFKGRVSRDNWVEQARVLAEGGETEFSKRVEDGDVY